MDRRAIFFLAAAAVCGMLTPLIPIEDGKPDITWVGKSTAVAFAILALLSWLDHAGRRRSP
ncbi:MAG: hypothetical protein HY826_05485 [Actinobacteria bacterium]|nr:hypothetical protein [Actinomycetota bacterium]